MEGPNELHLASSDQEFIAALHHRRGSAGALPLQFGADDAAR